MKNVKLHNGVEMPWIGLGVFKSFDEVENSVQHAIESGYRSIDTASIYKNERRVGNAIIETGIPRNEMFITTKVWNDDQGYNSTLSAFDKSLNELKMNYVDLYLIHWPNDNLSVETWEALEDLYKQKRVRAIGVSNFLIHHLNYLMNNTSIKPMVNQIEFHPRLVQTELLKFCQDNQIQPEASRPLIQGKVIDIPLLQILSVKYGKSPAQIVLRWDIQKGLVTIPKSVTPERIKSNFNIFDFEITEDDIEKIDNLNENTRMGGDPDTFFK
jgi:methylglyoxal/glyoxal reductase